MNDGVLLSSRTDRRILFLQAVSVYLVLLFSCVHLSCVHDDRVENSVAQQRIAASYIAKYDQCGQSESFILPVVTDLKESDLRACEAAVLAESCPLETIPVYCLTMFIKLNFPGAGAN